MLLSDGDKTVVVKQYDSLCKKSLANVVRNHYNKQAVNSNKIVANECLNNFNVTDKYFKRQFIFHVEDIPIIIEDTKIAKALLQLKSDRRKIILLYYFIEIPDVEIASLMDIPRATVQYKRAKALREMEDLLRGDV